MPKVIIIIPSRNPEIFTFSSVQFSRSVVSDSLQPHESQHARPPCPSPSPGVHSDSCSSSPWCHLAISCSVIPFSSWPQSLQASESFPMSQLFAWGGQSTGVLALASFLPKKSQGWSPSEWTGWISLQSIFYFTLFCFTILHWFCHTLAWIRHRCTWVPNPEPPSHLLPHIISLGHPSATVFWLCWVFVVVCTLSLVADNGDSSLVLVYRLLDSVTSLVAKRRF